MKVLTGHLTVTEKSVIKQMFNLKLTSAKTPKKIYYLNQEEDIYTITIEQRDKGLIPCAGSQIRTSKYKSTFKF